MLLLGLQVIARIVSCSGDISGKFLSCDAKGKKQRVKQLLERFCICVAQWGAIYILPHVQNLFKLAKLLFGWSICGAAGYAVQKGRGVLKTQIAKMPFSFFFFFTLKGVGLTVFCVRSKERILNFIYGLIFNSLNYSWFCPDQDCNWKKGTHCH